MLRKHICTGAGTDHLKVQVIFETGESLSKHEVQEQIPPCLLSKNRSYYLTLIIRSGRSFEARSYLRAGKMKNQLYFSRFLY